MARIVDIEPFLEEFKKVITKTRTDQAAAVVSRKPYLPELLGGIAEILEETALTLAGLPTMDAPPTPRWISVEEQLPRDSQHVLTWIPTRRVIMLGWYYHQLNGWYDERHTVCGVIHPTHWMPLPEPPKEEVK